MMKLATDARALLEALGYAFGEGDEEFLMLCAEGVQEEIKNACNTAELPVGLERAAADWIAARFLESRKSMGKLAGMEDFDYAAAVQQLQEGDTTVRYFEHASPEQRLELLIARLKPSREALMAHRRMKW